MYIIDFSQERKDFIVVFEWK